MDTNVNFLKGGKLDFFTIETTQHRSRNLKQEAEQRHNDGKNQVSWEAGCRLCSWESWNQNLVREITHATNLPDLTDSFFHLHIASTARVKPK